MSSQFRTTRCSASRSQTSARICLRAGLSFSKMPGAHGGGATSCALAGVAGFCSLPRPAAGGPVAGGSAYLAHSLRDAPSSAPAAFPSAAASAATCGPHDMHFTLRATVKRTGPGRAVSSNAKNSRSDCTLLPLMVASTSPTARNRSATEFGLMDSTRSPSKQMPNLSPGGKKSMKTGTSRLRASQEYRGGGVGGGGGFLGDGGCVGDFHLISSTATTGGVPSAMP
mmetsp:Transcript_50617/g.147176  ORF Transcript_50617/g.147176 Transcript_50617/m.147176 type:complete len:226 (+) Transcript_50617:467-1144(+)